MCYRILFVQPLLSPYTIPRYVALAKDDRWEIHVALEASEFPMRPGWVPRPVPGVNVHVLSSWLFKKRVADGSCIDKAVPYGLVSTIRQVRPHIVIVCNPTEFLFSLLAGGWRRSWRLGLLMEDTPHSQRHKQGIVAWLRRQLYRYSDFVICFSADADRYVEQLDIPAERYRSAWSVDPDWLESGARNPSDAKLESWVVRSQRPMRFLFVGALIERKGIQSFLEAWALMGEDCTDAELVVVGDGPLADSLAQFCKNEKLDNVRLIGAVPYSEMAGYYADADIFVLPTLEDIFSLVVTEAMAHGLPVLISIYAGAKELVEEGANGYTFDSTDIEGMAELIIRIIGESDRLPEMGKRSRDIISEFTHEKIMDDFSQILASEVSVLPVTSNQ